MLHMLVFDTIFGPPMSLRSEGGGFLQCHHESMELDSGSPADEESRVSLRDIYQSSAIFPALEIVHP